MTWAKFLAGFQTHEIQWPDRYAPPKEFDDNGTYKTVKPLLWFIMKHIEGQTGVIVKRLRRNAMLQKLANLTEELGDTPLPKDLHNYQSIDNEAENEAHLGGWLDRSLGELVNRLMLSRPFCLPGVWAKARGVFRAERAWWYNHQDARVHARIDRGVEVKTDKDVQVLTHMELKRYAVAPDQVFDKAAGWKKEVNVRLDTYVGGPKDKRSLEFWELAGRSRQDVRIHPSNYEVTLLTLALECYAYCVLSGTPWGMVTTGNRFFIVYVKDATRPWTSNCGRPPPRQVKFSDMFDTRDDQRKAGTAGQPTCSLLQAIAMTTLANIEEKHAFTSQRSRSMAPSPSPRPPSPVQPRSQSGSSAKASTSGPPGYPVDQANLSPYAPTGYYGVKQPQNQYSALHARPSQPRSRAAPVPIANSNTHPNDVRFATSAAPRSNGHVTNRAHFDAASTTSAPSHLVQPQLQRAGSYTTNTTYGRPGEPDDRNLTSFLHLKDSKQYQNDQHYWQ